MAPASPVANHSWGSPDTIVNRDLSFQTLVLDLSAQLIEVDASNVDERIRQVLASIGQFVQADRSYVFLMREGGNLADNTHEWWHHDEIDVVLLDMTMPGMNGAQVAERLRAIDRRVRILVARPHPKKSWTPIRKASRAPQG